MNRYKQTLTVNFLKKIGIFHSIGFYKEKEWFKKKKKNTSLTSTRERTSNLIIKKQVPNYQFLVFESPNKDLVFTNAALTN